MILAIATKTIEVGPELTVETVAQPAPAASGPRARVGSVLNKKWRLESLLGVGGMGAVYAATHRNGSRVAIKVLHARHSSDPTLARRLEQEACAANSVDHPGAVRIFDDGRSEDGAIFLVMELLEGEGLHTRLARKSWQVTPSEAMGITYGVLDVLAAAHARGIVHCDIKPENVFITRRGEVKLLDFGIAGMFAASAEARRSNEGDLFGTPGYMAPEQALGQGEEVDPRTDLWAVAATLHRMLTGRLVHEAPSLIEQLVDAGTRPVPSFATVLPEAHGSLVALMDRGLAFAKADRFADAAQMQQAVRLCAQSGFWGAAPRVPGVSVELEPIGSGRARPESTDDAKPVPSEPTMRIKRVNRGSRRSFLMLAGGAAMAAVSLVRFGEAGPGRAAVAPAPSPELDEAAGPSGDSPVEGGPASGQGIRWTPLAPKPPAPPAKSSPPRAGRRSKRLRRGRPLARLTADDDIWGRRH